jgi:aspartyl-tRNA(Asn)/glutamyl-tRNA(Gln) amidotransferase subunit A
MPVGVQLIGAPWRESVCLAAARTLEQAGIAEVRPPEQVSTRSALGQ